MQSDVARQTNELRTVRGEIGQVQGEIGQIQRENNELRAQVQVLTMTVQRLTGPSDRSPLHAGSAASAKFQVRLIS